jgi:hypothetical protein
MLAHPLARANAPTSRVAASASQIVTYAAVAMNANIPMKESA